MVTKFVLYFSSTIATPGTMLIILSVLHTGTTKSKGQIYFGLYGFAYQFFRGYLGAPFYFIGNDMFECQGQYEFCKQSAPGALE